MNRTHRALLDKIGFFDLGMGITEQKIKKTPQVFDQKNSLLEDQITHLQNVNISLVQENEILKKQLSSLERKLHKIGDAEEQRDWLLDELTNKIAMIGEIRTDLLKRERLSAIGELSSRLAHDLRNPLAIILNTIDLIKMKYDGKLPADILNQFLIIDRATSRMTFQLDEVLNFVRNAPLDIKKNSLLEMIQSSLFRIVIPDNIVLCLPKNDVEIYCDSRKVEAALSNLVMNAIQAIENEGDVIIRVVDYESTVQIDVEDSGPGMSEKTLKKIFEPLFTTKSRGTGLGLATVKNMIDEHHGDIKVSLNPTTFSITLPKNLRIPSALSMSS